MSKLKSKHILIRIYQSYNQTFNKSLTNEKLNQVDNKPAMMVVGWIFCFTSSSAFFNSSAAIITTLVVPSPT